MAVKTLAASKFRKEGIDNIVLGYGEVPTVYKDGKLGWGLPGGYVTFDRDEAVIYARLLDKEIRDNMRDVSQLLKATG